MRGGVEKAVMEELAASAASEMPFDARMRRRPEGKSVSHPPIAQSVPSLPPPVAVALPVHAEIRPLTHPAPASAAVPVQSDANLPARNASVPAMKSASELKEILRTMTAKNSEEKEHKQVQNQQSLKGALAEVLAKNKQEAVSSKQEMQKPEEKKPEEKKPFEIPEAELVKVLKGES
jgi:hypothetical protein